MNRTINEISEVLFKYFIANPFAVAVQQDSGIYLTKYIQMNPFIIEHMILEKGSIGCYQQGYKNEYIKWVCFDFDCKNKGNPDIQKLFKKYIVPFLNYLKDEEIYYLTEFSGRRGIHVWLLFDSVLTKSTGFSIVKKLEKRIEIDSEFHSEFALDLFPATDISKGNKVGKQVKMPLSTHRDGNQSFFFENEIDLNCLLETNFYENQLHILKNTKLNKNNDICNRLSISNLVGQEYISKYIKYKLIDEVECTVEEIKNIMSKTRVFRDIFFRLESAIPFRQDWFVMLGTFSLIDKSGELLRSMFSKSITYNEEISNRNILKWKDTYYPATFHYLYSLYDLEMEENLNPNETGLEFLLKNLNSINSINLEDYKAISFSNINETSILDDIKITIQKEQNYILANDENVSISILNELNNLKGYSITQIENYINRILKNDIEDIKNLNWIQFNRVESKDKIRKLVSLGSNERVITTHLAQKLAYSFSKNIKSFSYNVLFISKSDIFYNWYSSWGNFIDKIRVFLEIPFLSEWGIISLDIKNFYDNIDFLSVYNLLKNEMSNQDKNIFRYLVNFNEIIMRDINGNRKGVPQGPAYARIISEIYLSRILSEFEKLFKQQYYLYRYVDDIIIIYPPNTDGNNLFTIFKDLLGIYGLNLNFDKSRNYGKIRNISRENIDSLLRRNQFNYQFQFSEYNKTLLKIQKDEIFKSLLQSNYKFDLVSFIFSKSTDSYFSKLYFNKFKTNIFSEISGRGSIFANFYRFLFSNPSLIIESIENNYFKLIVLNSINFKNFISQLYIAIKYSVISKELVNRIIEVYFRELDMENIDLEEKTTIKSIVFWGDKND